MKVRLAKMEKDITELKDDMKVVKDCLIGADMKGGLVAEHQTMREKIKSLESNQNRLICALVTFVVSVAIAIFTKKI